MTSIEEFYQNIEAARQEYDADILFYSTDVNDRSFGEVAKEVIQIKEKEKLLFIVTTNGGSPDAAYQIMRFLQRAYKEILFVVPGRCKSAGTLMALGATSIILNEFSEFGPLDVQLLKPNELGRRKTGLLTKSSLEALANVSFNLYEHILMEIMRRSAGVISFHSASEHSSVMASALMAPVYAQIDPEVLGDDERNLEIAKEYGYRLNQKWEISGREAIDLLIYGYPSHSFVIDCEEAGKIFNRIETPNESLYSLLYKLSEWAMGESHPGIVMGLQAPAQSEETQNEQHNENTTNDTSSIEQTNGMEDNITGDGQGDHGKGESKPKGKKVPHPKKKK